MHFHLILTDECNLSCSYCRAKTFEPLEESDQEKAILIDEKMPPELDYDLDILYEFISKDPFPTITFYGGEPLTRSDLVCRIIREAPAQRFMIQTNGLLLHRLPYDIVNRFTTILVSLDGPENLTDANRGEGVYRTVVKNIRDLLLNGYQGELIARMTVNEGTDIVKAVHHLADNQDHSFSSIHWQIDANFVGDFSRRRFEEWVSGTYNPGVRSLVRYWVDHMESHGEILRWYPFLDPMEDMLTERPTMLRCGSGYANYSIMTDGSIGPCPIMVGMHQYYVGHISRSNPLELKQILIGNECLACRIQSFCGGRCLYSNIASPWGQAGRSLVCGTVENLYEVLMEELPRIRNLIEEGVIGFANFSHEKYNGCEIIP